MFYLVIDLEMCRVPRDYRNKAYHYAYETIQIGAVLLNEEFKQVGTIREYVHPEHGVIDPFIEKLTGIKNSQVKKAPCIGEALVHMIDWIDEHYPQVKVLNIALPDAYVEHGNVSVLREGLGIDSDSIIRKLKTEGWL